MTTVWVVVCIEGDYDDVYHIFSSRMLAEKFASEDKRNHVIYDYVLDFPERHEQRMM